MLRWVIGRIASKRTRWWLMASPMAMLVILVALLATPALQPTFSALTERNYSGFPGQSQINHPAHRSLAAGAAAANLGVLPGSSTGSVTSPVQSKNNKTGLSPKSTPTLSAADKQALLTKYGVYPYDPVDLATPGHLIMSPDTIVWGNVYSPAPDLTMSNGLEISEPTSNDSPDIALSWFDDGQGHYQPGPYYVGWRPFIQLKHPVTSDGSTVFTVKAQDRAGITYTTTLKIIWVAHRDLGLSAGGLDKQIIGNTVVFTGHVQFSPTANVGKPVIQLTANGFYNFTDPCNLSETNTTFTYTGQNSYDVTCAMSANQLINYPSGFDIYVNAKTQWLPASPVTFTAKFHTN